MSADAQALELSTRLVAEAARARGIEVEVLDEAESFLRLRQGKKTEYVRQATKTSKDSYVTVLLMENKTLTKRLLAEAGIAVPRGEPLRGEDALREAWGRWKGQALVVKPQSTNFGDGVTVFKQPPTRAAYLAAARRALAFDQAVLVERFEPGREFRFLVIGGTTVAILHRVPANVTGDGQRTIAELVEEKNRDPRRGEGYHTPLERLRLGPVELQFLADQGLTTASVVPEGRQVFLRENSNISTGGDSLDFTDLMPRDYQDLAARAAGVVGARICGVDMLIPDLGVPAGPATACILELNFNPALHIHDQPFQGANRHTADRVLDELGFAP